MEKLGQFLGVVDYVVIISSLVVCIGVGLYHKYRSRQGAASQKIDEYFLGGRMMPIFPIAISMLATSMTAVPIVSGMAEVYRHGMEYSFLVFGMQCGKILASYTILPVFRYLDYVSIYEYFERRFDRSVRLGFSLAYIAMNVFQAAVVLYLPTLLMCIITGLPYWFMASVSGVFCTLYCVIGGFKTVVWTDVIQFSLMFIGLIAIIFCGTIAAGGPGVVWKTAVVDVLFPNITWFDSSNKRFTVLSTVIFGIFLSLQNFTTNQAVVQRILSVKDIRSAQRSIIITIIFASSVAILCFAGAASIYTNFHLCDPLQRPHESGVNSLDLVLIYYVQRYVSGHPGLSGVVMAGILSSSLSTISSFINSFAANTLEDFIRPAFSKKDFSDQKAILISKILTATYGTAVTLLSFTIPYMGGAMKALVSVLGAIGGPLAGLMFLAMFIPRVEKKACIFGMCCGITFCLWLSIGSSLYLIPQTTLPLSTELCSNDTNYLGKEGSNHTFSRMNISQVKRDESYIFPLYKIPFVWYGPIGLLLTFTIGLAVSYFQEKKKTSVDPRLLSPLVRRWFKHLPIPEEATEISQGVHSEKLLDIKEEQV